LASLEACPCWGGTGETNKAAEEGTRQHEAYATHNIDGLSEKQAEAVLSCISYENKLAEALSGRFEGAAIDTIREGQVQVDDECTTSGYFDTALVPMNRSEYVVELLDCKFGRWPVEPAATNVQGWCYVLGAFRHWPGARTVGMHFLHPYSNTIDFHYFHLNEIPDMLLRVRTIVDRAKTGRTCWRLANPTTQGCMFCGRKALCPKLAEFALKIGKKFAPLAVPECIIPESIMDVHEAGKIKQLEGILSSWCSNVRRTFGLRALEVDGWAPEGYTLSAYKDPKIKDVEGLKQLARNYGVSDEILAAASSISIGPLEDAIKASAARGSKESLAKAFRQEAKDKKLVEDGEIVTRLRATVASE
jgi:hypothetical protein